MQLETFKTFGDFQNIQFSTGTDSDAIFAAWA
jgi:hypothetical protein